MKRVEDTRVVQKSTSAKPTEVTIKNNAIILGILCTKLYENPLKILVQEYMCNARDSHRENGNAHEPIEVVLPTHIDPTIRFRDFGVGISPDRVGTVFVYLGESTKTLSDEETGGHGLGSKTAWSYTDSFTIITIYNGIEYTYLCYIGNSGSGNLELISECITDKSNGTTIEVTVKPNDIADAERYVYTTAHFWDVKPKIKNNTQYDFIETEQTNFDIPERRVGSFIKNVSGVKYLKGLSNRVTIVMDGIIYRAITDYIEIPKQYDIKPSSEDALFVHFNTGELQPAINRENIIINDPAIAMITGRLEDFIKIATVEFTNQIDKCSSFTQLIDFLAAENKPTVIFNNWLFNFKGTDINYNRGRLWFYIKLPKSSYQAVKYEYNSRLKRLKRDSVDENIRIDYLKNKQVIFQDKTNKGFNRQCVKDYMIGLGLSHIYVIERSKVFKYTELELATHLEEITKFISNFSDSVVIYSDMIKKPPVQRAPRGPKSDIRVRIFSKRGYRNNMYWTTVNELMDDYDYLIDNPYNSMSDLIGCYNDLHITPMKNVVISDVNRKYLAKNTDVKVITYDEALVIMQHDIVKMMKPEYYKFVLGSKANIFESNIIRCLNIHKKEIMDGSIISLLDNYNKYKKRFDVGGMDYSDKVSNILSAYNTLRSYISRDAFPFHHNSVVNLYSRKKKQVKIQHDNLLNKYPVITMLDSVLSEHVPHIVECINNAYELKILKNGVSANER